MNKHTPIPAAQVAAGKIRYSELKSHDGKVYWLESRPQDKGRTALMCFDGVEVKDILPSDYSCRSKVHEYGGGVYQLVNDLVYFVNAKDQQIYVKQLSQDSEPCPLTVKSEKRFADFTYCEKWNCLIAVCEDHAPVDPVVEGEPETSIVAIDCQSGHVEPLVKGAAFYSDPRINDAGDRIFWIDWNHPNMPWDHTRLWIADVLDEKFELDNPVQLAGQEVEAIVQPEWNGSFIFYLSDRTGWWNLYEYSDVSKDIEVIYKDEKEYSRAPWNFSMKNFVGLDDGNIVGFTESSGRHQLYYLDVLTENKSEILPHFTLIESIAANDQTIYFIAGGDAFGIGIWQYDLESEKLTHVSGAVATPVKNVTVGQSISFTTSNGDTAFANLYLPDNENGKLPPLLVKAHGGPTGIAIRNLDWKIQYWTSRGFAVLDVNYRGSTGFGREYRNALYGKWGEVDVEDCLAGVKQLVDQGLVDSSKVVISGGSAGGYTVLRALITSDVFAAGTSYYGVADLHALLEDTHKFESRYLETCIAPLATHPERYAELSPINHVEKISCPMLFFQGLKDKVVPHNQTSSMVEKLKAKGNQVEMVEFPEEGHGFRSADAIVESLEREYGFYVDVFS